MSTFSIGFQLTSIFQLIMNTYNLLNLHCFFWYPLKDAEDCPFVLISIAPTIVFIDEPYEFSVVDLLKSEVAPQQSSLLFQLNNTNFKSINYIYNLSKKATTYPYKRILNQLQLVLSLLHFFIDINAYQLFTYNNNSFLWIDKKAEAVNTRRKTAL